MEEHYSGLPFPPPGDLPDPGIELASPVLADGLFAAEPPRKPNAASKSSILVKGEKRPVYTVQVSLVAQMDATPACSSAWYSPGEPRDTCLLICLILASGAARHLPAHLPDTGQVSCATPAFSFYKYILDISWLKTKELFVGEARQAY